MEGFMEYIVSFFHVKASCDWSDLLSAGQFGNKITL